MLLNKTIKLGHCWGLWEGSAKYYMTVFLLLTTAPCFADNTISAPVIRIADGDTITLLSASKKQIKIRLAGIDCPERGQPWGRNATEALKMFLGKEPVTVEVLDTDRYGRVVGNVIAKGVHINRRLVETGNCWVYPRYAHDKILFELHNRAKAANVGLWQLPENERVPPWEWRRK